MRISVSVIISDVSSGRWSNITAVSSETEILHSLATSRGKDGKQIEELKSEAYRRLIEQLTGR